MILAAGASAENGARVKPFRVLEHKADVGFEAFGRTREELFTNAAAALTDLMVDLDSIQAREKIGIRAEGSEASGLLVNWLAEILYLWDAEHWLFRSFEMARLSDQVAEAEASGEKFDPRRHAVKMQVKAITYHQLALEPARGGWRAQVYVDV